jgi:RNA polymerase sigma factor (sigma-70 family)
MARVMDEKQPMPEADRTDGNGVVPDSAIMPDSAVMPDSANADSGLTVEQLFEKAVAANSRRLLGIARGIVGNRASPEDVVQQAVMNLFQHRMRYDWREPGGLLRRAVVNESLRLLRQPRTTSVEEEYHGATSAPPEAGLIENETVIQVRKAIDKLPANFKAALVLCEYEQMPYAQIAQTLGASIPQVKTWIFRARRQLAETLKDYARS